MTNTIGQCRLCSAFNQKLVNSHIIPRSFYSQLHDPQGRRSKILSEEAHPKRAPNGLYDQFLCHKCEKSLCQWDDYAFKLLKESTPTPISAQSTSEVIGFEYQNVNYDKLKLFFTSLLWRAHVTKLPFFARVQLSELDAEELRASLYAQTALKADKYTVALGKSEQLISTTILEPFLEVIDGAAFWRIYIPGYVVRMKVDDNPMPKSLLLHLLYPGTGLSAYHHNYEQHGETAAAYAMVKTNLEKGWIK